MKLKKLISDTIKQCMKSGNKFEVTILRTIMGEAQSDAFRQKKDLSDEMIEKVIRKSKQGVEDNIKLLKDRDTSNFEKELLIYDGLLPKTISVYTIICHLTGIQDIILDSKSDGQATGLAMKYFKENNIKVQGKEVSISVKKFRESGGLVDAGEAKKGNAKSVPIL